jgi:hypothetical protein
VGGYGLAGFGFFGLSMSFQPSGRSNENDVNTKEI